jgi:hypothetical protein
MKKITVIGLDTQEKKEEALLILMKLGYSLTGNSGRRAKDCTMIKAQENGALSFWFGKRYKEGITLEALKEKVMKKKEVRLKHDSFLHEVAMLAMQSLIHNMAIADPKLAIMQREYYVRQYGEDVTEFEAIAKESYAMANEMVKERNNLKSK